MSKHGSRSITSKEQFLAAPAYPFRARDLFADLRAKLNATEGRQLSLAEIGAMMGKQTSTTHFWFKLYRHPQVLGLMTLLERLSSEQRQSFVEAHCRLFPTFADARLRGASDELAKLLSQRTGITIIVGSGRSYVFNAFGHSWNRGAKKRTLPAGIDMHFPREFVPVTGLRYINENFDAKQGRELVLSVWPRILTAKAPLLLFNGLWSIVPEVRNDILRLARTKHVILTDREAPGPRELRRLQTDAHLVTVSRDLYQVRIS